MSLKWLDWEFFKVPIAVSALYENAEELHGKDDPPVSSPTTTTMFRASDGRRTDDVFSRHRGGRPVGVDVGRHWTARS